MLHRDVTGAQSLFLSDLLRPRLTAQQGQTIYTITKANYAEVLPKLNHSDAVMTDIRNAINADKTVTVHDTSIRFYGWLGTGYTIIDLNSGAGAYMIGGGLDGGWLTPFLQGVAVGLVAAGIAVGVVVGVVGAPVAIIGGIALFVASSLISKEDKAAFTTGRWIGYLALLAVTFSFLGILALKATFFFGLAFLTLQLLYYSVKELFARTTLYYDNRYEYSYTSYISTLRKV